jgi:hypothetical protein
MMKYHFEIDGNFEYDMMPKIYKVILVGKGYIEDYEIPIEVAFNSKIKEIGESE